MRYFIVLFSFFIAFTANAQWVQIGDKLTGTGNIGPAAQGWSGGISADGKTVVVGGRADNTSTGAVWIYYYNGSDFVQMGNKLTGAGNTYAYYAEGVSISADGKTVVVGAPSDNGNDGSVFVYTFNGTGFVQVGNKFSTQRGNSFGHGVDISADGKTIIVGAPFDDFSQTGNGGAWIYTFNGSNFVQAGNRLSFIGGGSVGQGWWVSISGDGKTAAVTEQGSGGIRIYTFNGANFIPVGGKLLHGFLSMASLSYDGKTVIFGDFVYGGGAWIYTFNGSNFVQLGNKLTGSGGTDERQGYSVDISSDGSTALVGGIGDNSRGAIWVFTFNGTDFQEAGCKLVGAGSVGNALQGSSVGASADGQVIFAGGTNDDNNNGTAWVFKQDIIYKPSVTGVSAPATVCSGLNHVLSVFATGKPLDYQWYQDGNSIAGANAASLTLAGITSLADGNYTCTVGYSCDFFTSDGINITIIPSPDVTASIFPANPCVGTVVTVSGSGAPVITVTGGITLGLGFVPVATDVYTLTGVALNGCRDWATVTVLGLPSLTISGSRSVCDGDLVRLTVSGGNTYTWNNGFTTPGISLSQVLGITTYVVSSTGINNCSNTAMATVIVNSLPFVSISGDTIICLKDFTSLTASGANTYHWSNGSDNAVLEVDPIIKTGYTVVGTDLNHCKNVATVNIAIKEQPVVTISGANSICLNASLLLTASGAKLYKWSNNSADSVISVSPLVLTMFSVTGTGSNGCASTAVTTITIKNLPVVSFDLSSINGLCNTVGSISLTNGQPQGGVYLYLDKVVDILDISDGGKYAILYRYTDISSSCEASASDTLSITTCLTPCEMPKPPCYCTNTCPPPFKIYTGITPNGDGLNETWFIDSLFTPNKITIHDKWGIEVYHTEDYLQSWDGKGKDGANLPAGIYYYTIEIGTDKKRFAGTIYVMRQ